MTYADTKANGSTHPGKVENNDPATFILKMLLEHRDPTRGMPIETHRAGIAGQALVLGKWLFRSTCQPLINELLSRQRLFNGYVTDSYAQMAAELEKLRQQVELLSNQPTTKAVNRTGLSSTRKDKPPPTNR